MQLHFDFGKDFGQHAVMLEDASCNLQLCLLDPGLHRGPLFAFFEAARAVSFAFGDLLKRSW